MEERARMERVISRKAQGSILPDKKLGLQGLYTMMAPLVRGLRTSNTGRSRKKYYSSSRKRMEDPHVNYKGETRQKPGDSNREGRWRLLKLLRGGILLYGCVVLDSGSSLLVVKGLQGMYSAGCFDGSSYNRVRWQALGKSALLMGIGLTDFCISGGTLTSEAAGMDGGISSEDGDVGNTTDVGGARDGSVLQAAWSTITIGALAGSIFTKNAAQFWRAGRTSTSRIREYLRGFRIPVAQPNPSHGAKDGARVNLYFLRLDGNGSVRSLNSVRGPGVRFFAKSAVGRQPLEPFSHHDAPKEVNDEQENLNCSTNSVISNGMLGLKKLASATVDASRKAVGNIPLVEKIVDGVKQGSAKVAEKVKSGVQEDSLVKKAVAAVRNGTDNAGPSFQEAVEGFKQRLRPAFEKCRDYTKSSSLKETAAAAVASNPHVKKCVKVFAWKVLRTGEAPSFEVFLQEESSGDCAAQVDSETSDHGQDSGDPVTETPEGDNSAGKADPNRKC